MYHHKGGVSRKPAFEWAPDGPGEIRIGETEETQVFSSGDLSAEITKSGPLKIAFTRRGKKLTELSCKHSGYFIDQDNRAYMVQYLNLSVGEAVYGLGERFTGLYPIR
jgi:alpha-D-xyloside xylohydrolase